MFARTATCFAVALLAACTGFAHAGDTKHKPAAPVLPGVEGRYSIVAPAPEPPEEPNADANTIRAGHWELTVSGYVWVQFGAASGQGR